MEISRKKACMPRKEHGCSDTIEEVACPERSTHVQIDTIEEVANPSADTTLCQSFTPIPHGPRQQQEVVQVDLAVSQEVVQVDLLSRFVDR
jgi:hypothetical protein